jgi:hypothetical protein
MKKADLPRAAAMGMLGGSKRRRTEQRDELSSSHG